MSSSSLRRRSKMSIEHHILMNAIQKLDKRIMGDLHIMEKYGYLFSVRSNIEKHLPEILYYIKINNLPLRINFLNPNLKKYIHLLTAFCKNYKNVEVVRFQCFDEKWANLHGLGYNQEKELEKVPSENSIKTFAELFPYVSIEMELFYDRFEDDYQIMETIDKYMKKETKIDIINFSLKLGKRFSVEFSKKDIPKNSPKGNLFNILANKLNSVETVDD